MAAISVMMKVMETGMTCCRLDSFRAYEAMQCSDSSEPDVVPFFQKRRAQYLVCGERHVTVKSGCQLFAWGSNSQGQLGTHSAMDISLCHMNNRISCHARCWAMQG